MRLKRIAHILKMQTERHLRHCKIIINLYLLLFILLTPLSTLASNKVYEISNELMCPVCQGQTVAESNSGLAISMREVVKRQVSEGKSKKEILNYFVNIYGDTILATPPAKGFGIILYIFPVLVLVGSILFWIRRFNK